MWTEEQKQVWICLTWIIGFGGTLVVARWTIDVYLLIGLMLLSYVGAAALSYIVVMLGSFFFLAVREILRKK
ncbi:hypothetical protein KBC89_00925 [Candidatus Woesebacteria bacterium]|nr:hypothetical protein [Candidatus Woesebacteria bacterium]